METLSTVSQVSSGSSVWLTNSEQGQAREPDRSGFCKWLGSFINRLIGVFGDKMTASQLNSRMDYIFSAENGWMHNGVFELGDTIQTSFREMKKAGITYVIPSVAHDLPISNADHLRAMGAGGRSIRDTFKDIKEQYSEGDVKVMLPIAQSNNFGPFGIRGHFVLLEVDIMDSKIKSAVLHDSKGGGLDIFYGGADRLMLIFKDAATDEDGLNLAENFRVAADYRGEQLLLNGNDCARFAAYYAHEIASKGRLDNRANKRNAWLFFNEKFKDQSQAP